MEGTDYVHQDRQTQEPQGNDGINHMPYRPSPAVRCCGHDYHNRAHRNPYREEQEQN